MEHLKFFTRSMIILITISIPAELIHADSIIEFEVFKTEVDYSGSAVYNRKKQKENLEVYISKDLFYTVDKNEKNIYDFKNRKITRIDLHKKKYRKYSLYTLIGFRALELENRLRVFDIFRGVNKNILFEPVILEHNFSLTTGRENTALDKKNISGFVHYSFKKSPLARIKQSGQSLPVDDQAGFVRFLRYTLGGHNEILAGIKDSGKVPGQFTFYKYDEKNTRIDYIVKSIKKGENDSTSLEGLVPEDLNSRVDDFYSLLSGIDTSNRELIKQKMGSIEIDIQSSLENKNYLEALLGCLESGLYNAVFNIEICQNNISDIQNDEKAGALFTYLNPADKISVEEALEEFIKLEQYGGDKVYILWIFEGDMLSRMNKKQQALEKFYKALKVNPYIAGVYKDIGEIFYNNYNTDLAWLCWDTARSIYPDNSMLKPIEELEKKIITKYPDYF